MMGNEIEYTYIKKLKYLFLRLNFNANYPIIHVALLVSAIGNHIYVKFVYAARLRILELIQM
jgi:hypothetical protein